MKLISTKKCILIFTLLLFCNFITKAQDNVGIGTNTPDATALLDLLSTNKGLLVPRMTALQRLAIVSPANALLVYDTDTMCYFFYRQPTALWINLCKAGPKGATGVTGATGITGPTGLTGPTGSFTNNAWLITGNSGTVDGTNFLGTTDNVPFNIRVNNLKAGRIDHLLNNTFFGFQAANANATATNNTAFGHNALLLNTASDNLAIGSGALAANTTGDGNLAIGKSALAANQTGVSSLAIGNEALKNSTQGVNTAVGWQALKNSTTAYSNVALGYGAMTFNIVGSENTALGHEALYLSNGQRNIAVGFYAGNNITTGNNNIVMGFDIDAPSATLSNQLVIGNLIYGTGIDGLNTSYSSGNIGIGISTPASKFHVNGPARLGLGSTTNGSLIFNNSTNNNAITINSGATSTSYPLVLPLAQGAASTFLQNDGAGNLSWSNSNGNNSSSTLAIQDEFFGDCIHYNATGYPNFSKYSLGWNRYPDYNETYNIFSSGNVNGISNINHPGVTLVRASPGGYVPMPDITNSLFLKSDGIDAHSLNFAGTWIVKITTLSGAIGGGSDFSFKVGLLPSSAFVSGPGTPTDGIFFETNTNNGVWYGTTASASSNTKTSTATAPSTNWVKLEIKSDATGTIWYFYIDGVLKTTTSTNIPTAGTMLSPGIKIEGSTSSTYTVSGEMAIDYFFMSSTLTR